MILLYKAALCFIFFKVTSRSWQLNLHTTSSLHHLGELTYPKSYYAKCFEKTYLLQKFYFFKNTKNLKKLFGFFINLNRLENSGQSINYK